VCDLSSALVISCFFCGRTSGWVKGEGRNFKVSSPFIISRTASDCTENSVMGFPYMVIKTMSLIVVIFFLVVQCRRIHSFNNSSWLSRLGVRIGIVEFLWTV